MTKVMPWLTYDTYRNDEDVKQIVDSRYDNLFIVDGATPEQVRQVCALPEIMAALREWAEADAALADACDPENRRHFGKEMSAMAQADAALLALYERLK